MTNNHTKQKTKSSAYHPKRLLKRILATWPLTPVQIIRRRIDKSNQTVLDVGCGKGITMDRIKNRGWSYRVGVDIFFPYLEECKQLNTYDDCVLCDIRNLPVERKSIDLVLCVEVLEHLDEKDGRNLIKSMEEIARHQVIITTPVAYEQYEYDNNKWQQHKASWKGTELERLGYQVTGTGFRGFSGERGIINRWPKWLKPLLICVWNLGSILTYYFPELAGDLICVKKIEM